MSLLLVVLCLLFFGMVLLLVTLNSTPVDVNLLLRSYHQVSLSLVIVVSVLAGIMFTSILGILDGVRLRIQNRRLRKLVAHLGKQAEEHQVSPPHPGREGPAHEMPTHRVMRD